MQEARRRIAEDRDRWTNGISCFVSETSVTDAAFFRSPGAWRISSLASFSGNAVAACQKTTVNATIGATLSSGDCMRMCNAAEERAGVNVDSFHHGEADDWVSPSSSSPPVGIEAHHDGASRFEQQGVALLASEEETTAGSAADVPPERTLVRNNNKSSSSSSSSNNNTSHSQRLSAAGRAEHHSARRRNSRLESLASLARQGLQAHWEAFFRDEVERTRMAATAADMAAERWAHHQRRAAENLWAPWLAKEWEPANEIGGGGAGVSRDGAGEPQGIVGEGGDGACGADVQVGVAPETAAMLESTDVKDSMGEVGKGGIGGATMKTSSPEGERQRQPSGQVYSREGEKEDEVRCDMLPEGASGEGVGTTEKCVISNDGEGVDNPDNTGDADDAGPKGTVDGEEKGDEARCEISPDDTNGQGTVVMADMDSHDGEGSNMANGVNGTDAAMPKAATKVKGATSNDMLEAEGSKSTGGEASTSRVGDIKIVGGDGASGGSGGLSVRHVAGLSRSDQQVSPTDSELPASQMVVFVGKAMAFHLSTIRECHVEHFNDTNRQRRSSFSMPRQRGQTGQR